MTKTEFLLARIADDEAEVAELRKGIPPEQLAVYDETAVHVAAEFKAKRKIIHEIESLRSVIGHGDEHESAIVEWADSAVLSPLAEVYDDHPDFDPAWRV